ncbi:hypothetical protein Tco_0097017, partial [Tanacetum coccineum]
MQQLQKQAKILKENPLNKFNALKTTTQRLERQTFTNCPLFQRTFSHLFHTDVRTFKYELSQNMNNLEKQLNNEILHEKDSKSALSVIKVHFDKFIHSKMLKSSNYDSDAREARQDFKNYTQIKAQSFKDLIIQHMESIEQCIVERARHEQEIHNRLKRKLQIQECMDQKVKASDASSGEKDFSRIVSDKGDDQCLDNQSNTSGDESSRSRNECNDKSTSRDDTDIRPSYDTEPMVEVPYNDEYNVFAVDTQHSEQPKCIINTCVVEKVDSNVIPDLPDMYAHTELQCLYLHKVKECECLTQKLLKQTETDLKAELQDKNIVISELKKLIEKCKGKYVETKFDKPSVVRQPNAQRILKPSVLGKPTPFSDSLERKSFSKTKQAIRNTNVIKLGMYRIDTRTTQTRAPQLPQTSRNTNPRVSTSTGVIHITNVSRPQLRSTQMKDKVMSNNSQVKFKKTEVEDYHRISSISNKTNANHDECILKYLSKVNSRASAQKKDAQSHKTTKRYMLVEKKCDSKKHDRQTPIGKTFSPNKSSNVYLKTTPPRSSLTWKPMGKIFTQVGLKWIPIRKSVETRYNTNDSALPLGKKTHNPKTVICANSSSLSAVTSMASEPISSKGSSN